MRSLSTSDIMQVLAASTHGNRELDIFMFILLHPDNRYFYEDGQYYMFSTKSISLKRINLIRTTNKYTTEFSTAMRLLKRGWVYDIRINNMEASASIATQKGVYITKAPSIPLAICYLIAKIINDEGYNREDQDEKGVVVHPRKETLFFTQLDYIEQERKKLERKEKLNERRNLNKENSYFR